MTKPRILRSGAKDGPVRPPEEYGRMTRTEYIGVSAPRPRPIPHDQRRVGLDEARAILDIVAASGRYGTTLVGRIMSTGLDGLNNDERTLVRDALADELMLRGLPQYEPITAYGEFIENLIHLIGVNDDDENA